MSGPSAPTIRTRRLLLRPFRPSDLPAYTEIRGDPETVRFLPGGPGAAAEAASRARAVVEAWNDAGWASGHVPWAVEHDTRLVGHLGLRHVPELGETELLYMLDRSCRGRGLATEGALAAIAFARERLALATLAALAHPANAASIRVMRRCGFEFQREVRLFGMELVLYRLRLLRYERSQPA